MVAPASGWLRTRQRNGNGGLVVPDIFELVGKGNCAKNRRCETLSPSGAVLFRTDLGGLYARMCLESHRVGAANADLYCVALMPKLFDTPYTLVLKLGYFYQNSSV